MSQGSARTIEQLRFGQRYIGDRIHELEELPIGRLLIEIVSLVANSVTLAAFHSMIVVVEHFLEGAAINHRLIALEAFPLFAFKRLDSHGTKLDPLHCAPRLGVPLQDLNSIKAGV